MASSQEYWTDRARLREGLVHKRTVELEAELEQHYRRAARKIRQEINDFYSRYADEQELSYEQAKQQLSRAEMREWKMSLADYEAQIKAQTDPKIKARLQADLDARAYASRIDRLDALVGQIDIIADDLYLKASWHLGEALGELYEDSYNRRWFDLQQRMGYMFQVAGVDQQMIADIVSYPWSGANYSDRLWKNKQNLVDSLSEILTQGIIRGESPAVMSKELADRLGANFKQVSRLIRTETAHIHNEADARVEREAGIEWYEYIATLDEGTCEICGPLDGEVFKTEERTEGVNAPVMHPRCRCTTAEHDPEEYLDWEAVGEPMPERMTWEEWKAEQGIKETDPESQPKEEKMPWLASLPEEYRQDIAQRISLLPEGESALLAKYSNDLQFASVTAGSGSGMYNHATGKITFDVADDSGNPRGQWFTLMHEMGHYVDFTAGGLSIANSSFYGALRFDYMDFRELIQNDQAAAKVALSGNDKATVSDIFSGLSRGVYYGDWWHRPSYWTNNLVCQEAFAGFFEAAGLPEHEAICKQFFPRGYAKYKQIVDDAVKGGGA